MVHRRHGLCRGARTALCVLKHTNAQACRRMETSNNVGIFQYEVSHTLRLQTTVFARNFFNDIWKQCNERCVEPSGDKGADRHSTLSSPAGRASCAGKAMSAFRKVLENIPVCNREAVYAEVEKLTLMFQDIPELISDVVKLYLHETGVLKTHNVDMRARPPTEDYIGAVLSYLSTTPYMQSAGLVTNPDMEPTFMCDATRYGIYECARRVPKYKKRVGVPHQYTEPSSAPSTCSGGYHTADSRANVATTGYECGAHGKRPQSGVDPCARTSVTRQLRRPGHDDVSHMSRAATTVTTMSRRTVADPSVYFSRPDGSYIAPSKATTSMHQVLDHSARDTPVAPLNADSITHLMRIREGGGSHGSGDPGTQSNRVMRSRSQVHAAARRSGMTIGNRAQTAITGHAVSSRALLPSASASASASAVAATRTSSKDARSVCTKRPVSQTAVSRRSVLADFGTHVSRTGCKASRAGSSVVASSRLGDSKVSGIEIELSSTDVAGEVERSQEDDDSDGGDHGGVVGESDEEYERDE